MAVDRSKVLRRAHEIAKDWEGDYGAIMSQALGESWAIEKASSGTKDSFEELFHDVNNQMRKQAGYEFAYNVLDMSLHNCKQCISATAAGTMEYEDLVNMYGEIPRHKKCGCFFMFSDGKTVQQVQREQIVELEELHGDLEKVQDAYWESLLKAEERRSSHAKAFGKQMNDLIMYIEGFL